MSTLNGRRLDTPGTERALAARKRWCTFKGLPLGHSENKIDDSKLADFSPLEGVIISDYLKGDRRAKKCP